MAETLAPSDTGVVQKLFTREDISRLFAGGVVRLSEDGVEFLCKLANTPGSGGIRACLDLAQKVIDFHASEVVTEELLRAVFAMTAGSRQYGALSSIDNMLPAVCDSVDRITASMKRVVAVMSDQRIDRSTDAAVTEFCRDANVVIDGLNSLMTALSFKVSEAIDSPAHIAFRTPRGRVVRPIIRACAMNGIG